MKKIFIIVFLFILTGCTKIDKDAKKFLALYPDLKDETHLYKNITIEEVFSLFESKTGIIIFSFPVCPYCQTVMPILNEAAKEHKLNQIYYYDIYNIRDQNTEEYQRLLSLLNEKMKDLKIEDNEITRITVPDVYVVKNGKILNHHIATFRGDDGKWIKDLSPEQRQNLKDIYLGLIKELQ